MWLERKATHLAAPGGVLLFVLTFLPHFDFFCSLLLTAPVQTYSNMESMFYVIKQAKGCYW